MVLPSVVHIAQICAALEVRHIILSPGSRCAPLTLAFVRHPEITTRTVSDERSAAFIALGMARQMQKPVGLVCTSGSAVYNYAPAVAEAFFQQVPLLVFTADRPPEWIDQLDGQTIRQRSIYGRHIKASYELPVGQTEADQWYASRMVSEAVNISRTYPQGPVHVNIPLREPFYPAAGEELDFTVPVKVIEQVSGRQVLPAEVQEKLKSEWQTYPKKLIVAGQHVYDGHLLQSLQSLGQATKIPVVADIISNLHAAENTVRHADVFLARKDEAFKEGLQPDLLISCGLSVISKNLKLFLRKYHPKAHWHVQPTGVAADSFQSLTRVIHGDPAVFFQSMAVQAEVHEAQYSYFRQWEQAEQQAAGFVGELFEKDKLSLGEFGVVQAVLQHMPESCDLHLANSMAVRYANLIGLTARQIGVEVFANRGTSGIEGSSSTAVGSALASGRPTLLLTGDMAFFYDRNAFWHNYDIRNLRILILNNRGGNIFRMIDGPGRQPELEEYFVTRQGLYAENTAKDFNMDYQRIELGQEEQKEKLMSGIKRFLDTSSASAKILEIVTEGTADAAVFSQYKNLIHQHYGA